MWHFFLFGSSCLVLVYVLLDISQSSGAFTFMEHSGGEKNFFKGFCLLTGGFFSGTCYINDTLQAAGFSYAKRERNHCEQPSAFPSSMREFVTPHVIHLMSIYFLLEIFVQKNANFSPKALTKYCI